MKCLRRMKSCPDLTVAYCAPMPSYQTATHKQLYPMCQLKNLIPPPEVTLRTISNCLGSLQRNTYHLEAHPSLFSDFQACIFRRFEACRRKAAFPPPRSCVWLTSELVIPCYDASWHALLVLTHLQQMQRTESFL